MLKDFLKEIFGLVFYGLRFEQILWAGLIVLGIVVGVRTWKAWQTYGDKTQDLPFRVVMTLLLVGGGFYNGLKVWTAPSNLSGVELQQLLFFKDPLILHTYGVCIALGFVFAIWVAVREARRTGLDSARLLDLAFWVLIAGMLGSRVVFMMVEWRSYVDRCVDPGSMGLAAPDCFAVLRFWEGGLVFYGGLIGALIAAGVFLRKHNLDAWRYADAGAVGIPVGQFLGRLGCLAAGCCHGKYVPSDHPVGLHWPPDTAAYDVILKSVPDAADKALFLQEGYVTAHPTQLYSSGGALLVFIILVLVRTRKRFNGQMLATYLMLYAITRATIEIFRGDTIRGFIFRYENAAISQFLGLPADEPLLLSTSQFISILMFCTGVGLWIWRSRSAPPDAPEPAPAPASQSAAEPDNDQQAA